MGKPKDFQIVGPNWEGNYLGTFVCKRQQYFGQGPKIFGGRKSSQVSKQGEQKEGQFFGPGKNFGNNADFFSQKIFQERSL